MRKSFLAAAVTGLVLALAGVALATASFKQIARVTLTARTAGASSGVSSVLITSDLTAPASKPKAVRKVVFSFPPNTRFNLNTSAVAACAFSDNQIKQVVGGAVCPAASRIGSGTAELNVMPMVAKVRASVKAYLHTGNQIIVVLYLNQYDFPGTPPVVLHATASGPALTIDVPRLVYGKGTGAVKWFPGVTAVLTSLKLTTGAFGSGANALLRAGSCAAGKFVVRSHFSYGDHSKLVLTSTSRCS